MHFACKCGHIRESPAHVRMCFPPLLHMLEKNFSHVLLLFLHGFELLLFVFVLLFVFPYLAMHVNDARFNLMVWRGAIPGRIL